MTLPDIISYLHFTCAGGQEELIGIFAKNSPEWHMSMQGIVGNRSIAVPLYQTLGISRLEHFVLSLNLMPQGF